MICLFKQVSPPHFLCAPTHWFLPTLLIHKKEHFPWGHVNRAALKELWSFHQVCWKSEVYRISWDVCEIRRIAQESVIALSKMISIKCWTILFKFWLTTPCISINEYIWTFGHYEYDFKTEVIKLKTEEEILLGPKRLFPPSVWFHLI